MVEMRERIGGVPEGTGYAWENHTITPLDEGSVILRSERRPRALRGRGR